MNQFQFMTFQLFVKQTYSAYLITMLFSEFHKLTPTQSFVKNKMKEFPLTTISSSPKSIAISLLSEKWNNTDGCKELCTCHNAKLIKI